jgi:hypothetical protein
MGYTPAHATAIPVTFGQITGFFREFDSQNRGFGDQHSKDRESLGHTTSHAGFDPRVSVPTTINDATL